MIYNFGSWPQNYLTSPRHSGQVCSLFQACCSVFPRNWLKDLLEGASEMYVVLSFDICNVYEIVTYDWLYSQYLVRVKIVDMASGFRGNFEDWHLFLVC